MRKYIATCMIAAASLASCTQNEDFTSPQNEQAKHMKFDVAYVGKNTRAATGDLTTEGLGAEKLILWCDAYATTPGSGIWISDKEPLFLGKNGSSSYWDVYQDVGGASGATVEYPGSSYTTYFTALAPAAELQASNGTGIQPKYEMGNQYTDGITAPDFDSRKLIINGIPVVQEIDNGATKKGIDYLISTATSTTEEVALTFKHLLSKLRFAVWTDEPTMNGTTPQTRIELNQLIVYLPKDVKANYTQTAHNAVGGSWSWEGFTAPGEDPGELTAYQDYTLFQESGISPATAKEVKYFAGPTNVHLSTNWDNVKLDPTFFIAPNGSTNVKIYIDIKYTVRRNIGTAESPVWSETSESTGANYSAGHQVVERTKMLVPINDSTYGHGNEAEVDANHNEGLSQFHQGFLETLYICLRADQKLTFSTNFGVDGWVNDPVDINQK